MSQDVDNAENASVESGEQHQEAHFEAEASKMGWVPKEKFRGDPSRWIDAKSYVERQETVLPIVKKELAKTRAELDEVRKSAQEWQEFTTKAKEREVAEWRAKYEQAVKDKAQAITNGDGEAAVEAEARQKELEAARPQPQKDPHKEAPKENPAFTAWKANNDWFGEDKAKTRYANGVALDLARQGVQGEEFFRKLDEEMSDYAPAVTTRAGPQRGGKPSGGGSKGVRSYDNLTTEYKAQCDRQVRTLGIKKEDYVAHCPDDAFRS